MTISRLIGRSFCTLHQPPSHLTVGALLNVERLEAKELTQERFFEEFYGIEPVVIANGIPEWPEVSSV